VVSHPQGFIKGLMAGSSGREALLRIPVSKDLEDELMRNIGVGSEG
jgi:hypothetical protein